LKQLPNDERRALPLKAAEQSLSWAGWRFFGQAQQVRAYPRYMAYARLQSAYKIEVWHRCQTRRFHLANVIGEFKD
jgi:hypothetical protein